MQKRKFKFILINLLYIFIFFILYNLITNKVLTYVLELGILNAIIYSIYIFKQITSKYFNIFSLFILLFFVFLSGRPILHLIGYENIQYVEFYFNDVVDLGIINRVLLNQIIAIHSYVIGVLIYWIKNKSIETSKIIYLNDFQILNNKKILYFFIVISLLVLGKYSIEMFNQIITKGYLANFTGDIVVNRNIFEWFLSSFIIIIIFYYLSNPYLGSLRFGIILLILYVILTLTTGRRGPALLLLVFSLFYLYLLKRIHISYLSLLLFFAFIVILSTYISAWRTDNTSLFSVNNLLIFPEFIWARGISMHVLSMTIKFENNIDYSFVDIFGNIWYIIDYYINKFSDIPEKYGMYSLAVDYKIYGPYISYIVDPTLFDMGYGLGGSYIAQFYAIGKETAQFFGGLIAGIIYSFLYSKLLSKKFEIRFVAFYMLSQLIYIPRHNFLDFLTAEWIVYICLLFLSYLNKRIKS